MPKETPAPISTRQQIADLQQQIANLKGAAIDELKARIKDARAHLASLEAEMAELTGTAAPIATVQKRTRKPSVSDDDLHKSIRMVLAENPGGISARGIAIALDINYPRVAKYIADAFLKDSKVFKKTGTGAGTRLFLP